MEEVVGLGGRVTEVAEGEMLDAGVEKAEVGIPEAVGEDVEHRVGGDNGIRE